LMKQVLTNWIFEVTCPFDRFWLILVMKILNPREGARNHKTAMRYWPSWSTHQKQEKTSRYFKLGRVKAIYLYQATCGYYNFFGGAPSHIPTRICDPIFREHWYQNGNPDVILPVFPKNGNTGLAKLPAIDPNFVTLVNFLDFGIIEKAK
jgi:hypothetical protein